jgi:hypothetical protein
MKANCDRETQEKVAASLSSLPTGTGWICSGEARVFEKVAFPKFRTFDNTATPLRDGGEITVKTAPVDQDELRKIIGQSVADAEANDPKALKAEIARLKAGAPDSTSEGDAALRAEIHRLGQRVVEVEREAYARGRNDTLDAWRAAIGNMDDTYVALRDEAKGATPRPSVSPPTNRPENGSAAPKPILAASAAAPGRMNGAAGKLLAVLDTNPPIRRTWAQTATLAGLKARGGHFNAGRKALIDSGAVVVDGDLISIATPSATAPSPADGDPARLVETWAAALDGSAPRILRQLFTIGGSASRDRLARELDMAPRGGHWNSAWAQLRSNGIVTVAGDVAALTSLFHPSSKGKSAS